MEQPNKYQDPELYPGALLLDEIEKLPKEQRDKVNYTGICSIISQEIAARAIRQSIHQITERNELEED